MKKIFILISTICLLFATPVETIYADDSEILLTSSYYETDYYSDDIFDGILGAALRAFPGAASISVGTGVVLFLRHNKANKKISATKYLEKNGYIVKNKTSRLVKTEKDVDKVYYSKK